MTKATLKLLEAAGLIIVMGAWVLEWSIVRGQEQAGSDLRASISSLQNAYSTAHTSAVVQLEAAVSRATAGREVTVSGPNSYYAAAWESPEVRAKWAVRTTEDLRLLRSLSMILQQKQRDDGIRTAGSLSTFRRQLENVEADFRSLMVPRIPPNAGPPTPDAGKARGRDAGTFDLKVGQLHRMLAPIVADTFMQIQERAEFWANFFRSVFGLGTLVLITAKCWEWWLEHLELRHPVP